MSDTTERYAETRPAFGAWLLRQDKRGGWIAALAKGARLDGSFPREGNPEAVRKWLSGQRASGDDWEAIDDAENDWLCL